MWDGLYARLPVFGQNVACSWAGWRRARSRFTSHFQRCLEEWERSARGPLSELHRIQSVRLHQLVERARANVPAYRELPPPVLGADPAESIASTLERIPCLEKSRYRADPESFIARDVPQGSLIEGKTSGTTGSAIPLWYTPRTLAEEYATIWRQRRACGVSLTDPNLTFNGQIVVPFRQAAPPFWRHNWWGRQTIFSLYHMSPEHLRSYVDAVHRIPARYVQGYPSSLHLVARSMLNEGRALPPGRLAAVFTSSESLLAFHREAIEAAFGAPVRDRYGTSEFAVSMTECAAGHLHVDMEFCIVEVEPHEETADFVRGPLLVTGLANDATPFLRYRIGDVGTRLRQPCPCGRPGDVFLDVDGRIEDYVQTPDGRLIGRLDHIFKDQRDVAEAQILQESKDAIEVLLVRAASWGPTSEGRLLEAFRARLGQEITIRLRPVDSIPREANGKFRAVKSSLGQLA